MTYGKWREKQMKRTPKSPIIAPDPQAPVEPPPPDRKDRIKEIAVAAIQAGATAAMKSVGDRLTGQQLKDQLRRERAAARLATRGY